MNDSLTPYSGEGVRGFFLLVRSQGDYVNTNYNFIKNEIGDSFLQLLAVGDDQPKQVF